MCAAALTCLAVSCWMGTASAEAIRVRTSPVLLSTESPDDCEVGKLTFLAGLSLHASARDFGGFSGLHISPDGKSMLAVSDMGHWLQADLVYDEQGALKGLRNVRLTPMLGTDGKPVSGKSQGDAEDLVVMNQGIYVSFERRHRLWRYPQSDDLSASVPVTLPAPADIATVKSNKGLEALVGLPGGTLLLLTEESLDKEGNIRGWLGAPDLRSFAPLRLRRAPPFAVTGATLLPDNSHILILERRYSIGAGLGIRLRRVGLGDIKGGALLTGERIAEFRPGQTYDNFEGIAAIRGTDGSAVVFLLSDDNFNGFQRTLLMHFRLEEVR